MSTERITPQEFIDAELVALRTLVSNVLIENKNFRPGVDGNGRTTRPHHFEHYPRTESYVAGPLRVQAEAILERIDRVRDSAAAMVVTPEEIARLEALSQGVDPDALHEAGCDAWCHEMDLAPMGKNVGEPLTILLYVPTKRFRKAREGFFDRVFDCWAWYGATSKAECLANPPVAWRHLPAGPE